MNLTVIPGAVFGVNEPVTISKLNALGRPNIDLQGLVNQAEIGNGAVNADKLAALAVETAKIAAGAVTNAKVSETAGIEFSKLESVETGEVLVGGSDGAVRGVSLVGDLELGVCKELYWDGEIAPGLTLGGSLKGVTSGATGRIVGLSDDGNSGYVLLADCNGTFQDNEALVLTNEIGFDGLVEGKDFHVGDVVLGHTSGATGVVEHLDVGLMVLARVSGVFQDNEELWVNGESELTALVNGPWSTRGLVNLDGHDFVEVDTVSTENIREKVYGEDIQLRSVDAQRLKPEGTAGQFLRSNGTQESPSYQTVSWRPSAGFAGALARYDAVVSGADLSEDYVTLQVAVPAWMLDGGGNPKVFQAVISGAGTAVAGLAKGKVYWAKVSDKAQKRVKFYLTEAEATAGTPAVDITSATLGLYTYVHGAVLDGLNCKVFCDSNDNNTVTGFYLMGYTTPLNTASQVLAGGATDLATNPLGGALWARTSTTLGMRFYSPYLASVRGVVFEV